MEQLTNWNSDPLRDDDNDEVNSQLNDSGNPVDFLNEVRNPCLICGDDVEIDIIVKQEVVEDFEEGGGGGSGDDCGGVTIDHHIFHWFLKWFRVDILANVKKGKQKYLKRGWDGQGGDILRFCGNCKLELTDILELQKQLDELEKRIKDGLGEVRGKMEGFEGAFQRNGIYERDDRYRRVRSKIIKISGNPTGRPSPGRPRKDLSKKPLEKVKISRKSSRKAVPVSRFDLALNPTSYPEEANDDDGIPENNYPEDLMISTRDRSSSQNRHLIVVADEDDEDEGQLDIKPDIDIPNSDSIIDPVSCSPPPSPPSRHGPSKKFREPIKKKAGTRKAPKSQKKVKLTPKPVSKPPKKSKGTSKSGKPLLSADLDNDDNYYLDDNPSSSEEDKPDTDDNQRPLRKKRKVKDADFILDEDNISDDDNDSGSDLDWDTKDEPRRKHKYHLDPSTNLITMGGSHHTFQLSTDVTGEKVSCSSCNSILRHDKSAMWRHITKYHTNRFPCPNYECTFKGASTREVQRHFTAIHEGVPQPNPRSPCRICGKPIQNTKRCRTNHEWTHLSTEEKDAVISKDDPELLPDQLKRRWQCDECGKGFHVPSDLKRHKERYHSEGGFQAVKELCAECGETFVDLEGHRKRVHKLGGKGEGVVQERWWECTEGGCGKRFRQVGLLTKHKEAVHKGIRPWGCNLCTRSFVKEEGLKKHLLGHLGVREWKCGVEGCGGAFVRKSHLQRHTRIYHGEGARPRRKVFLRGPTVLGVGFKKEELQRRGVYYPPSALKGWAKGRVPGHLMGREEGEGDVGE